MSDETLQFGPWFADERHAVAADGCHYEIGAPNKHHASFYWQACWYSGDVWPTDGQVATEAEAIEAARDHDRRRRNVTPPRAAGDGR